MLQGIPTMDLETMWQESFLPFQICPWIATGLSKNLRDNGYVDSSLFEPQNTY